jgi:purine-binding chemotaxis protein CheW
MAIDWREVRRRMEVAQAAVLHGTVRSHEQKRAILRSRAQLLAQESGPNAQPGETIDLLEFLLAWETYAIEGQYLREVLPLRALTPVPGAPPFIAGIINVRGQVISVVDVRTFFELPGQGISDLNRVIVLRKDDIEFGILADAVVGIRAVPLEELQPSLPTLTGIREEYLKGIARGPVIVLDAARLIADQSLVVHGQP